MYTVIWHFTEQYWIIYILLSFFSFPYKGFLKESTLFLGHPQQTFFVQSQL